VDFCQLIVHPVHPVSGEWRQHAQGFGYSSLGLGLSYVDWRNQLLGMVLSWGEVHHQGRLRLEHRLVLRQCVWLNYGSGLLASKVALRDADPGLVVGC
jgi:hypothetical protein